MDQEQQESLEEFAAKVDQLIAAWQAPPPAAVRRRRVAWDDGFEVTLDVDPTALAELQDALAHAASAFEQAAQAFAHALQPFCEAMRQLRREQRRCS